MKNQKRNFTFTSSQIRFGLCSAVVLAIGFALCGCDNMRNDSRLKPYEKSKFFSDKMSSRPLVEGTVPRGYLREDEHLYAGKVNGRFVTSFPFPVDKTVLERGRERFNIYCAVCHNQTGTGDGMIVWRGFKKPPSFHEERLKNIPIGYLFDVITNGFGDMARYSPELPPEDRWAIIAYLRALQLSQSAPLEALKPEERAKFK